MICDNCIHYAVCDRLCFENHCGYKHTEADVIAPELKRIKAKIEDLGYYDHIGNLVLPAWKVYDIIDHYIEEPKGEGK